MTFKRSWSAMRRPLAITGVATSALLVLAACASNGADQQQQQQDQDSAIAQPAETQSSDSAAVAQSGAESTQRSESTRGTIGTVRSSAEAQQQSEAAQSAQQAAGEQQGTPQQDDGMGGMDGGTAVAIADQANYNELSPRLQLLRDSGYPVYLSGDYIIALGTPDLSPGMHRISVVIEGPVGLVEFPAIAVTVLPEDSPGEMREVIARFSRFPDGVRGFHVTAINFTQAGRWNLILHIPAEDGFADVGLALDIAEDTSAPSVGDAAPASASRTLLDVPNIADLSTGETPDPGVYLISVADALQAGKPFVVVFASPGFCTNAFCGPQAEVLSEVRERHGDDANYIHIDLYENPEQVRLGEEPIETPILEEWGLHTDEWTFVVNAEGVVVARFEAFAPFDEVEAALATLLEG
ncbi:MAG: thioredoxin family protein [Chloroflexi bacterium]|nr:thioredoxin family protein [Chloroflexota bacterium]MCY3697582.1 thioredoxin family protein [Chloroflexota bacterium]